MAYTFQLRSRVGRKFICSIPNDPLTAGYVNNAYINFILKGLKTAEQTTAELKRSSIWITKETFKEPATTATGPAIIYSPYSVQFFENTQEKSAPSGKPTEKGTIAGTLSYTSPANAMHFALRQKDAPANGNPASYHLLVVPPLLTVATATHKVIIDNTDGNKIKVVAITYADTSGKTEDLWEVVSPSP